MAKRNSHYALMGVFYFKTYMSFFTSKVTPLLTKKTKKHLIIIVLATLVHNFTVFPVHAADNSTDPLFNGVKIEVIKSPESEVNLQEQLMANEKTTSPLVRNIDKRTELAKDFKIVDQNTPLMDIYEKRKKQGLNNLKDPSLTNSRLVTMTAYNSEVAQCDGNPCTTANGFNVCEHGIEDTVAANFLPLGTIIKVPELFGDREFVVRDRTAKKYGDRVDFWMIKKSDALKFGKRQARIVVVE